MKLDIEITGKDGDPLGIPLENKEGELQVRHDGIKCYGKLYFWEDIEKVIIINKE